MAEQKISTNERRLLVEADIHRCLVVGRNSAITAIEVLRLNGSSTLDCCRSKISSKNLRLRMRTAAYQKALLTLSTQRSPSGFKMRTQQLGLVPDNIETFFLFWCHEVTRNSGKLVIVHNEGVR